jgi:hypothetical protein
MEDDAVAVDVSDHSVEHLAHERLENQRGKVHLVDDFASGVLDAPILNVHLLIATV